MKPLDEQRDKSSDKEPHTKKDKDKLIKKYTQHLKINDPYTYSTCITTAVNLFLPLALGEQS